MTSNAGDPTGSWNVVRLDAEAQRWRDIARDAFWIRCPVALDANRPLEPPGMAEIVEDFRRHGAELHVLEHDLAECLNEFKQVYQVLYRDPSLIAQKKFSIVYHTDNFLVRVHKFRENVYRLLALALGLDHSVTPKKFDSPREEQVVRACERRRLHSIARCITDFDHNPAVIAAIRERHLFVHQFREDLRRPELGAQNRARDFEDPVAAEVSALTDVPAIDRHADRRADELFRVLNAVRDFRNTLYDAIEDEIVAMIANRSPETRRRLQSFVDFRKALRELAE